MINELEKYNLDLGLAKIALEQRLALLASCEIALEREQNKHY